MGVHSSAAFSSCVSILSTQLGRLEETVRLLDKTACDAIHFDVMDGHFVPNLTFGFQTIKQLRPLTRKLFDVHLMISNPDLYIDAYADAGAEIISIHREIGSIAKVKGILKEIKSKNMRSSLAYNPKTDLDVEEFLSDVDQILLMSVNPGFGGQTLIESVLERGLEVRRLLDRQDCKVDLQIDGGVNASNLENVKQSGFNMLVAGSYVMDKSFPYDADEQELLKAKTKVEMAIDTLHSAAPTRKEFEKSTNGFDEQC